MSFGDGKDASERRNLRVFRGSTFQFSTPKRPWREALGVTSRPPGLTCRWPSPGCPSPRGSTIM